ncbi:hypothetical protein M407DRAFT_161133 [Tulasnella calospora MUT 4182]|uniref:Uncharacterized protein n=1 Tax=Tulasnella calospora MUT 4182 TaxID=1051891 RepID=A0A0C3QF36_9AGAM|nr:hypothetical protein M407DRAFT_161133 [Tulasnella calospora MUT 4182]
MSHLNRESVSSIQLALELEHELDDGEHHPPSPRSSSQQKGSNNMSAVDPLSTTEYDSEVLTSIIIQLRADLAKITQERDESNQALAESGHKFAALEAKAADLEELFEAEKKRADKAEAERDEALKNAQENEEQVNLLRAKVEESRRGVMRLQAESRRMSTQTVKTGPLPLDLSAAAGARSPGLVSGFSNTAKRASFQLPPPSAFGSQSQPSSRPMGMGHRRISSLSDPGPNATPPTPNRSSTLADPVNLVDGLPPSPVTHTFEDIKTGDGTTIKTKRLSLVAKRDQSPPGLPPASVLTAELDSVRGELSNTKKELETVKHELAEAVDKREASDACIKALREFIAEQAIGESSAAAPSSSSVKDDASTRSFDAMRSPTVSLKGLRLPPLPTEADIPEEAASSTGPRKAGWGLRLWNSAATTPGSEASAPAATPQVPASSSSAAATPAATPLTSFVSSWTRSVSGGSQASASSTATTQPATPAQPEPASAAPTTGLRKFSFFGKAPTSVPAPATNAKDPQTASMHSTAPSISSSRTPDLVHSVSTSPQTDTRSLKSGALSEEEEHDAAAAKAEPVEGTILFLDPSHTDKNLGDVTPTVSSSAVSVNSDSAHPERMESVAL